MDILIIIDCQNDFLSPNGTLYLGDNSRKIISFIQSKISEFTSSGGMVCFVTDQHIRNDNEFKLFSPHAIRGDVGGEIVDELRKYISGSFCLVKNLTILCTIA